MNNLRSEVAMQDNDRPGRRAASVITNRVGRVLTVALLLCGFALVEWIAAGAASAAITRLNAMPATPQINIGTAGTNSTSTNFTLSAGSDRYLVVALGCTDGGNASRTFTVTYGGTPVQRIIGVDSEAGQSQRRSAWIGGLPMGTSASGSTASLAVSVAPAGTCDTWDVWIGSMAGVHQSTPVNGTYQVYENNVDNNQSYSLPVEAGGAGILAVGANTNLSSVNEAGHTWSWSFNAGVGAQGTNLYAVAEASNPTVTFAANYRGAIAGATINPAPAGSTTVLDDGTNPASVTVGPGDAATMLNAFTLQTTSGSDTVTAATVTLAPANAFANLASVELTNDAGTVVYGTVANPASNTVNFTGLSIPVTTTLTQFKVRVTPKAHAAMPAVPGASYATTGTVTAFTCTNVKSGTDTGSATVTVDNASPGNATFGTVTPGNGQVVLNWTNPGADFSEVVLIRRTATISDVPTEGATYTAGGALGASTVVYVGSASTTTDTTVVNGTGYYYKIFAKDPYGNYSSGGATTGPHTPTGPTLTVGNGTNPGNPAAPLAPGAALTSLNAFTLQTSTGTDTVTTVTVTLTPGSHEGIGAIAITNAAATVTYGTLNNPASSTPAITLSSNITASTTSTQYLVRIQPKSHAAMPVPPGALYTVSGTVTNVSSANTKIYQDTGSATIEIDNASPDVATWGAIVPDNTTIELNWVNPSDPDIDESAPVVVLRKAGSTFTGAEKPSEGVAYAVGNTIGAATVASLGTDAFGVVEGFIDTGLTNFTDYYYAIYVKDVRGNYSLGEVTGPHQPWMPVCVPAAPTLSVTPATRNAIPTDVARYTVSLTNNDNYLCAPTTFTVDASDANLTDFDPSLLNVLNGPQVDPLDVTLSYGQTRQITLTVFVKGTATLGNSNVTTVSASAPGHAAPAPVQVTTLAANPLMHNSRNTGSTKWATSGGWGITGGKYGTFNCFICHAESSHVEAEVGPNVKKIRQTIQMPADAPAGDNWPNGTKTISGVEFLDTRAGTADYSYAVTPSKHNASTKVCQVCHTFDDSRTNGVQYHAYDMSAATDGQASHSNGGDCLGCHPHQGGFKAQGCTGCHGYPLNDLGDLASSPATGSTTIGAHVKHEAAGYSCDYCHGAGSSSAGGALHATGAIAIDFFGFGQDEGSDGTYFGHTQVTTGYAGSDAGAANDSRSCNAVYCHGGTIGGSSPAWTGGALACGSCHNATSGAAGWLGSHAVHLNAVGMNCSGCHGAGYAKHDSGTGAAPAGHLNGAVVINLGSYGSYSKASPVATQGLPAASAYGTCSVTCHGSGTPTWGASLGGYPAKCVSCHNDGTAGTALINAVPAASKNVHAAHVNAINDYVTDDCAACHGANAHLGTHANHANDGSYPDGTATFGGQLSAYSTVNRNCTNTCHQATTSNLWVATPPALACLDCHSATFIGGNNAAKGWNAIPTSGLHNMTAAGVQKHDNTLTDGNAGNGVGCGECHVTEPASHIDGSFTANGAANGDRWVTRANMTYTQIAPSGGNSGTCFGTLAGLGTGCHSDGGNWHRQWSTAANSTATTPATDARCTVCHGVWGDWRQGTTHYKTGNSATSTKGQVHDATPTIDCVNCHVYTTTRHENGAINLNNNGATPGRTNNTYGSGTAGCGTCHGNQTDANYNFPISYFTQTAVSGTAFVAPPCSSCHDNAGKAATVPQVRIGTAANSSSSHVDADGPGLSNRTINVAGATARCEDCHNGHASGTPGANKVHIPTWSTSLNGVVPTMNWGYSSHGYKIQLGGTATASTTFTNTVNATTEAEMCWGCHDKVGVSEWGINNKAKTGGTTYDYGYLYTDLSTVPGTLTSNWVTGKWRSGKGRHSNTATNPFWYKRGSIQSTHSVNFDSGTVALTTTGNTLGFGRKESPDTVANIRCSYCHDVHGTHNGVNNDTAGGTGTADAPYLRGTWKGNPYPEDGAPQLQMRVWSGQGGTSSTLYGKVPRASALNTNTGLAAVTQAGGWWIDQNSNNPNSTTNVHASSGLCAQCHGAAKTGTWNTSATLAQNDLYNLNWSTNGVGEANIWVSGFNGHANSVINGPGRNTTSSAESYARNIFNRRLRGSNVRDTDEVTNGKVRTDMGLATETTDRGWAYRGSTNETGVQRWYPRVGNAAYNGTTAARQTSYRSFAWGTPVTSLSGRTSIWATGTSGLQLLNIATEPTDYNAQPNYHTFTCSKCHNPHASRLPKLMITNCLDTNHNTWEDDTFYTGAALTAPWANTRHSQWASAQNCHRLDARAALTSGQTTRLGVGWNRVTPWLEFTNPNSTRTAITPSVPVQ